MILWVVALALMPVPAVLVIYQTLRWPARSADPLYRALDAAIFAALLAFLAAFGSAVMQS